MDTDEINFSQLSDKVYENFENHERTLKDLCVIKSVIKPVEFFDSLQKHIEQVATPSKYSSSQDPELSSLVVDYTELFKTFEEYPSNLRKIPPKKRGDPQRANTTVLKGTSVEILTVEPNQQQFVPAHFTKLDRQPNAKQLFKDYQRFLNKLCKISDQASAKYEDDKVYQKKIKQVQGFAQQLDKLMPKEERDCANAFTDNEAEKLKTVADNLEQLNYLRSHENIRLLHDTTNRDLEALVEILSNSLMQMNCFIND